MLTFFLLLVMLVVHTPTAAAVTKSDLQQQLLQLQSLLQQLQAKIKPAVQGVSTVSYTKTIYVDGNLSAKCSGNYSIANRNCSGSNGDAYPTIGEAVKVLVAGTEVKVRAGTYRESITFPSSLSGTAAASIGISGYGSERPVLSGASPITNWQPCTAAACGNNPNWANMYYAKLPTSMFPNPVMPQLIENGQKLSIAAYPKASSPVKEYTSELYPVDVSSVGRTDGFTSAKLTEPAGYWDGAEMRFWLHAANNYIVDQKAASYSNGQVTFAAPLTKAISKGSQIDAFRFVNTLKDKAMSQPGEYVFTKMPDANNEHTVYVWPNNKANLNAIEISHRNVGFLFMPSYFNLKQFEIRDFVGSNTRSGGVVHPKTMPRSFVSIDDVIFKNIYAPSSAALNLGGISDLTVSNSKAYDILSDTRGLFATDASRVIFKNNHVKVVGSSAIGFFTIVDGVMEGNFVEDYTSTHGNAYTCYINCKNVLIKNNRAYNTGRIMLAINDGIDMKIIGNVFDGNDNPELSSSFIAIRAGAQGTNYVLNNAFLRMPGDTAFSLASQAAGVKFIVKNNIIDGSTNQFTSPDIDASNNLWTGFAWNQTSSRGWTAHPTDKTETNLSKLFSQYNGTYSPASGSPTVDAGFDTRSMVSSIAGVSAHTDLNGGNRPLGSAYDMGPFEAGSGTVPPPPTTAAPTLTLSASPSSVTAGGSATITWAATNATSCTASGAWSGTKSTSGSQASGALNTTGTQTFSMTCTGTGGSVTQSAAVSVTATTPTTPAPTVTLTASPSSITTGGSATLTWSSTNATACTASGAWSGNRATSGTGSTGTLNTTGIQSYILTCTGAGGSGSATAAVTVTAPTVVDTDKDTIADATDNCPTVANQNQANYDGDTQGDACDTDDDNDGILDTAEKSGCVLNPATSCGAVLPVTSAFSAGTRVQSTDIINVRSTNMTSVLGTQPVGSIGTVQAGTPVASNGYVYIPVNFDTGLDGMVADAFLSVYSAPTDTDLDTIPDTIDNCPLVSNATQANFDNDSQGDACDTDDDNDGILDTAEKSGCQFNASSSCGQVTTTPAPTVTLSASPTSMTKGGSATLTWSSTNASSCTAAGTWSGTKATSGTAGTGSLSTTGTKTFSLTCTGAGGSATKSVSVSVTAGTPETPTTEEPTPTLTTRVMTTENLNVRSTPNGTKLGMQPKGMKGTQSTAAPITAGGYSWVSVDFDTTPDGYVVSTYLTPINGTTLTESQTRAEIQKLLKQLQELQALLATLTAE